MNMEDFRYDTDRGRLKYSEETFPNAALFITFSFFYYIIFLSSSL